MTPDQVDHQEEGLPTEPVDTALEDVFVDEAVAP